MMRGLVAVPLLAGLAACDRTPQLGVTEDAAPSPNASILPAPLSGPTTLETAAPTPQTALPRLADAAQPSAIASAFLLAAPEPLRGDREVPADALSSKETFGLAFTAEWRWLDAPGPPKAPEVHAEGIAAARKMTSFRTLVSVAESGRMRMVFDGRAFPLPLGSELRARADRLGNVLVFPGASEYRPVPPGALRALFGDRRLDVLPLLPGEVTVRGSAPARGGQTPRRVEIVSRMGTLTLDVVRSIDAGLGGPLLCRALVELIAVDPTTPACLAYELPVRAQFAWPGGGSLVFETGDLAKRVELPVADVLCPPASATIAPTVLPSQPSGILLTREEIAGFRSRAVDVGPALPGAPADGLLARNASDGVRYLLLDGVPLTWLMPGGEQLVTGMPRGRYVIQWRSFLGDATEPPKTIEIPARVAVGEPPPDAGAPPPKTK